MPYHPRTLAALSEIEGLQVQINKLNSLIAAVRSRCTHNDYKLTTMETMAFEYTPIKRCIVCGRVQFKLKKSDREEIVRRFYYEMEMDCTPEMVEERLQGWNKI